MAWFILVFHIIFLSVAESAEGPKLAKTGCQEKCGAVDIPYPFGIGANCSLNEQGFALSCNEYDGKMVPFYANVEVINITLSTAQVRIYNEISSQCYINSTTNDTNSTTWSLSLDTVYRLSNHENSFTVIGCETLTYNEMWDYKGNYYRTGCVSGCYNPESLNDGSCTGNGCCQTSIPSGINYYDVIFHTNYNYSDAYSFDSCTYAAVLATDSFSFRTSYLTNRSDILSVHNGTVPVVLDWSIGNKTCKEAQTDLSNYACVSNNSECFDSRNGPGYFCNCSTGYQGNPYLHNGCQDIDECQDNSTCSGNSRCRNTRGSYHCICPPGTRGNDTRNPICTPEGGGLSRQNKLAIGICTGFVLLVFCFLLMQIVYEKRKVTSIREKYFQQYGGRLLLEEMRCNHGSAFSVFSEKELKEATNNFHESNLLGQGGNGTVYIGTLKSDKEVAIKKCKTIDERNKKEFGKEILILSEINHKNIVRIVGCCLEVEIPILVYEFIPNGTLFDLLHSAFRISLSIRLQIAQEAGEALAYLHSWAFPPIVHCDVKSANILLDENYVAKVSDFGASALAPSDQAQFLTLVQGTRGYLDPQCVQTGQLTVKSDVYSFGVVLVELLTRKKPFYLEGSEERCLSMSFLTVMKERKLDEILDAQILDEENMNLIMGVAELARECLNMEGEKRPEMREVAERLDKFRKTMKHPWMQDNHNEIESLRVGPSGSLDLEMTSYHSLEKKAMLVMETGR